jgi:hypothetical protein
MYSPLIILQLAAIATAIPLPASPPQLTLQGFSPVQTEVAAGREVLADVILYVSQPTNASVWISVYRNGTTTPATSTFISLCHFASACPLPAGTHTVRVPALLPRASAPGSYIMSASLHAPSEISEDSAFTIAARVHDTLQVRGCPPCGTVLAYTRNGTPSTLCARGRIVNRT